MTTNNNYNFLLGYPQFGSSGTGTSSNAPVIVYNYDATDAPNGLQLIAGQNVTLVQGSTSITINAQVTGSGAPTTASYITAVPEASLPDSRYAAAGNGITVVDGGAQNPITFGIANSVLGAAILTATNSDTILTGRRQVVGGSGITIVDGGSATHTFTIGTSGLPTVNGTGNYVNVSSSGTPGSANSSFTISITGIPTYTAGSGLNLTSSVFTATGFPTAIGSGSNVNVSQTVPGQPGSVITLQVTGIPTVPTFLGGTGTNVASSSNTVTVTATGYPVIQGTGNNVNINSSNNGQPGNIVTVSVTGIPVLQAYQAGSGLSQTVAGSTTTFNVTAVQSSVQGGLGTNVSQTGSTFTVVSTGYPSVTGSGSNVNVTQTNSGNPGNTVTVSVTGLQSYVAGTGLYQSVAGTTTTFSVTGGSGSVQSVQAGNLTPLFTTTTSSSTTNPNITFAQVAQNSNLSLMGPVSGASTNPTFRPIQGQDIYNVFTAGSNITLSQSGSNISISFSASGGGGTITSVVGSSGANVVVAGTTATVTVTGYPTVSGSGSNINVSTTGTPGGAGSSFTVSITGIPTYSASSGLTLNSGVFSATGFPSVLGSGNNINVLQTSPGAPGNTITLAVTGIPTVPTIQGSTGTNVASSGNTITVTATGYPTVSGTGNNVNVTSSNNGQPGNSIVVSVTGIPVVPTIQGSTGTNVASSGNTITVQSTGYPTITGTGSNINVTASNNGNPGNSVVVSVTGLPVQQVYLASSGLTQTTAGSTTTFSASGYPSVLGSGNYVNVSQTAPGSAGNTVTVQVTGIPVTQTYIASSGLTATVSGNSTTFTATGYATVLAGSGVSVTHTGTPGSPGATFTVNVTGSSGGSGSVTSVSAGNLNPLFNTTVNNASSTPAISYAQIAQNPNTVFIGPSGGASANPTFRQLVGQDLISGLVAGANVTLSVVGSAISIASTASGGGGGSVTSVNSNNAGTLFNVSVANQTTTPTFSYSFPSTTANQGWMSPNGTAGSAGFRSILGQDISPIFISGLGTSITAAGSNITIGTAATAVQTVAGGTGTNVSFNSGTATVTATGYPSVVGSGNNISVAQTNAGQPGNTVTVSVTGIPTQQVYQAGSGLSQSTVGSTTTFAGTGYTNVIGSGSNVSVSQTAPGAVGNTVTVSVTGLSTVQGGSGTNVSLSGNTYTVTATGFAKNTDQFLTLSSQADIPNAIVLNPSTGLNASLSGSTLTLTATASGGGGTTRSPMTLTGPASLTSSSGNPVGISTVLAGSGYTIFLPPANSNPGLSFNFIRYDNTYPVTIQTAGSDKIGTSNSGVTGVSSVTLNNYEEVLNIYADSSLGSTWNSTSPS